MQQALAYIMGEVDGQLAVWISPKAPLPGAVENPEIAYDGGEHAVLYRSENDPIALDYIPEEFRARLLAAASVLVGEGRESELEYTAKAVKVARLFSMDGEILSRKDLGMAQ
ncbi:MAG: hypothetical protein LBL52_02030 [Rickettsiales bacterium]|jgi:hypothetical protein|nr:hypothetical protein [Rickettsiales bacterium]